MSKRPIAVIVISLLLIVTGAGGFFMHLGDHRGQHPFDSGDLWVAALSVLAVVAGVYMLMARNWARWLAMGWIAFHVIISIFHSLVEVGVHALVCAAFAYFLFRPGSSRYFRRDA